MTSIITQLKSLLVIGLLLVCSLIVFAADKGAIRGKIVDEAGKAIKNAHIQAEREGTVVTATNSNDKGEFILADLSPGEYLLSLEAEGYKSAQLVRKQKVEAGKTTKVNDNIALEKLQSATLIRGAVFNDRGFSLPGAKVEIERLNITNKDDKFRKDYLANDVGQFAFRLPNATGQYKLTASASGFETTSKTVEISAGEVRNIAISLTKKADK